MTPKKMTPKRMFEIAGLLKDRCRARWGNVDSDGLIAAAELVYHSDELRRIQVLFDTTKFVQVPVNPARAEEEKQNG